MLTMNFRALAAHYVLLQKLELQRAANDQATHDGLDDDDKFKAHIGKGAEYHAAVAARYADMAGLCVEIALDLEERADSARG